MTFRLHGGRLEWLLLSATDDEQQFKVIVQESGAFLALDHDKLLSFPGDFAHLPENVEVEFGLCDQQVLLVIDGQTILRHAYDRATNQRSDAGDTHTSDERPRQLAIGCIHAPQRVPVKFVPPIQIDNLKVWRDVYYLDPQGLSRDWTAGARLGADEYFLLGDNQPVSIDSRHWEPPSVLRRAIVGHVYRSFWTAQ